MDGIKRFKLVSGSLTFCSLLIAASAPALAADRMTEGQWETSMTTDGATRNMKYCIDAAEAAGVNANSQTGRAYAEAKAIKTGGRCKVTSYEIAGDAVSYSMACGDRTIQSTQNFHSVTSEGTLTTTVAGQAPVVTKISSHRIGSCPAK